MATEHITITIHTRRRLGEPVIRRVLYAAAWLGLINEETAADLYVPWCWKIVATDRVNDRGDLLSREVPWSKF